MRISRSSRALAATLVVAGLTTTPAPAQDLRTPDAQDAAARQAGPQHLQSPDAQDAASPTRAAAPGEPAADGFDWTSAAIGAGGGLIVAVTAAGALATARRRGVSVS